jgi:hypothetical protein
MGDQLHIKEYYVLYSYLSSKALNLDMEISDATSFDAKDIREYLVNVVKQNLLQGKGG